MYSGERIIDDENAVAILKLADYLQIRHLVKECAGLLEDSVNQRNCFKRLKIAKECNLDVLREALLYYMVKEFKYLNDNYRDKFFQLDKDDLIEIISDNSLNTTSERTVCNLAIHWLLHNFEARKDCFEEVMKVLKLPLVSSEYLIGFMQIFPQLQALPYVQRYINEGLTHQLVPCKRSNTDTFRCMSRVSSDMIDLLMIVGGEDTRYNSLSKSWHCAPLDTFLEDNPDCFTWKVLPNLQNFLKTPGMLLTVYGNSDLYIIGGNNDGVARGNNYHYNGNSGRFIKVAGPATTHVVKYSLSECFGDYIYVIGGETYDEMTVETVSRYHTKQDLWENMGCLVEPVSKLEALSGIIGNRIYIFQKRLFQSIEVSYFQVYDTRTDSCAKHRLFDFDQDYILGYPEAIVSHNEAIYLFSGADKPTNTVSMVKFTDHNGMKFERVGEEFYCKSLLSNCEMLCLNNDLYLFGGKEALVLFDEEYDDEEDSGSVENVLKDEIVRFSLTDKKFYEVNIKLPEAKMSFMIKRFTARRDTLKIGTVSRGQN